MPAAQPTERVTLPSIQEMFPAELLGLPPQRGLRLPQPVSPLLHHAAAHRSPDGGPRRPAESLPSPATPASPRAAAQPAVPARRTSHSDEERRHACPTCGKAFNRPSSLAIHVNTHTGAKPYACPFPGCGRRFNVNSNMRRHLRNHTSPSRPLNTASPYTYPLTTAPRAPYPFSAPALRPAHARAPVVRVRDPESGSEDDELSDDDEPCVRDADLAAGVGRLRLRTYSTASSTASSPRSPPAAPPHRPRALSGAVPGIDDYSVPAALHPSSQVYRLRPAS